MPTHKKKIDRDKYYNLAKEQGYRSRAAFKLIQINKKHDFLSKARVVLDLCAAPGGWCQVAAKLAPSSSIVLGIDLLPIRPIRNVKTLVSDITTASCRALVKAELQGWSADVVLCDGAPNVGAEYSKDAFVQNSLSLSALKTATDHLGKNGTFVSKVYRSADYNALIWVFKQLFDDVQAIKPSSSRSQSAEIFMLCLGYKAPDYLDPKLLDPEYVFRQVDQPTQKVNIFDAPTRIKSRSGYDSTLNQLLTRTKTVSEFVASDDPTTMLAETSKLTFSSDCDDYAALKATDTEVRACCDDLKVLNKGDFKRLLKWRDQLRIFDQQLALIKEREAKGGDDDDDEEEINFDEETVEETEEDIQDEILALRAEARQARRREKKKERRKESKQRERQALGMNHNAFDLPDEDSIFSLKDIKNAEQLEAVRDVVLEDETEDFDAVEPAEKEKNTGDGDDDPEAQNRIKEELLDESYDKYLSRHGELVRGTKSHKRTKKAAARKAEELAAEDTEMWDGDQAAYVKILTADNEDESDSSDSEDEKAPHPLLADPTARDAAEPSSARVSRWFSDPIFETIESETAAHTVPQTPAGGATADKRTKKGKRARQLEAGKKGRGHADDDDDVSGEAARVLGDIPASDKKSRQAKRKKGEERRRAKEERSDKLREDTSLQFVPAESRIDPGGGRPAMTAKREKRALESREAIRAGMGKGLSRDKKSSGAGQGENAVELVAPAPMERCDERVYNSDDEGYDSEDRNVTLALGTMMLRKSRAKKLVDASYNRYAWNDPTDLPDWFVDDEQKHYRPQLPVPKPLLDQIRAKFLDLASKPIKKVAEARARKRHRTATKLKTARTKAEALSNQADMSESQKLREIGKVLAKGSKDAQVTRPGKTFAVAKKFNGGKAPKGSGKVKLVDKRMKCDTRSMKRSAKKKENGGRKRKR